MCYICERQGHVGPNYKAALREIGRALKVWGRKKRGPGEQQITHVQGWDFGACWRNWHDEETNTWGRYTYVPNDGKANWLTEPKKERPWTAKDFDKWQAAHRYTLLPGA